MDNTQDRGGWELLVEFATRHEADFATARLESEEIPALIKGNEPGIFGPGMAGATPFGVRLFVPSSALERASEILGLEEIDGTEGDEGSDLEGR